MFTLDAVRDEDRVILEESKDALKRGFKRVSSAPENYVVYERR